MRGAKQPRRQGDRRVAEEEPRRHDPGQAALRRPEQLRRRPDARQAGAERPAGSSSSRRSTPRPARRCSRADAPSAMTLAQRDAARAVGAVRRLHRQPLRPARASGSACRGGCCDIINLAHFAFAFLAAYLCYQLASVGGMDPLLTLALIVPLFFALGVAVQWLLARFSVSPLQLAARHLRPDRRSSRPASRASGRPTSASSSRSTREQKFRVGALFVPVPELLTLLLAVGAVASAIWAAMRYTDLGRRCARSPRTRRSPPPSASTRARTRCCWPASAARWRASPASASR